MIEVTCYTCGKKISKYPSEVKKRKKHYCCKECNPNYHSPWNKRQHPSIPILCKCGCNGIVWGGNEYCQGHNSKINHPMSGKHKIPWNKGKSKIYSRTTLEKMSEGHKGRAPWIKNKGHSKEAREKMSVAKDGCTPWNKGKKTNQIPWNKGKTNVYTEGTLKKLREAGMSKCGDKHPNWKGGIAYLPYCPKFNDKLKERIRQLPPNNFGGM